MTQDSVYQSISQVAALLNVPTHVLRFWEEQFPQLKPMKKEGGRRYYRAQDVELLQQIYDLLYNQGYTIKGAKKYLKALQKGEVQPIPVSQEVSLLSEMESVRDYLKAFLDNNQ